MIGVLLIILTIAFFCAWNLKYKHKKIGAIIVTILLLADISAIILNYHNHYGMRTETQMTSRKRIIPNKEKLFLYSKLGSQKKHDVILYRTNKYGSMKHTPISINNHNHIKRTNSHHADVVAFNTNWVYKNKFAWLSYSLMQPKLHKSFTKVFYIPKSWHILSIQQAKIMKKDAKMQAKLDKKQLQSPQAKIMLRQKMQMIVQQKVQAIAIKNPKVMQSPTAKAKLIKQITKQTKEQYMNKTKKQIISQALQKAEQSPIGYKG